MAFLAHDYNTRLPGEAEMIDEALGKLHNQFKRVEWEPSRATASLGDQPARAFDFDATDAQDVDVRGKVYLLGYRGFGYWLFLWTPAADTDAAAAELSAVLVSAFLQAATETAATAAPTIRIVRSVPEVMFLVPSG